MTLRTPVVLFAFRRPALTERVLARVRSVMPSTLYLFTDGPRSDRREEPALVDQTRRVLAEIDWPCEVIAEHSEINLGCKRRIVTGLDVVFSRETGAIILEDDCLPDISFFGFCEELLSRYEADDRLAIISGNNFVSGHAPESSFYFSRYTRTWGWATWSRFWHLYDRSMDAWVELDIPRRREFLDMFSRQNERLAWDHMFDGVVAGFDTWDIQLAFTAFKHSLLSVRPQINLVENIGFGADATHTTGEQTIARSTGSISPPLLAPPVVARDEMLDELESQLLYPDHGSGLGVARRLLRPLARRVRTRRAHNRR